MPASRNPSLLQIPSPSQLQTEYQINLFDRTISQLSTPRRDRSRDAERENSDAEATPVDGGGLRKRLTNNSLSLQQSIRKEINKQKYAKYGQHRYDCGDEALTGQAPGTTQVGDEATAAQKSYLEHAQARARAILKRKRNLGKGKDEQDTIVDILYENQRGIFFFGIPKYSSNSLLPTDPKPWQNAQFRTSASDIRNAQVPDPSWEWAWKSWYVDMSRDVDEEGWEYSFAFVGKGANAFAWHGNHPWFHSFVRRRRWLRMRRRRDLNVHKTKEKAHELTADYFTIHPKTLRPVSLADGRALSSAFTPVLAKAADLDLELDKMEINNIGDLFLALRHAPVDREKIRAVRQFVDGGGDEIFYLGEQMSQVMGMFLFQSSRRQLLSDLIDRHEQAHKDQDRLTDHQHEDDDDARQKAHKDATRHADYLLKAVHAADEEVKKLEYWSDIKGMTSDAPQQQEEGHEMPSFSNKQSAQDGAPELKKHAEDGHESKSTAPSRKSSAWFDSQSQNSKGKDSTDDTDLERYVTAPESASEMSRKGKGKASARELDGVLEETEDDHPAIQTVEPVAEDT